MILSLTIIMVLVKMLFASVSAILFLKMNCFRFL
jgi:hypothetical protein